jgi:TonB family protein
MRLAAQQNGLEGKGIQPWYLHATWQLGAWKDRPAIQGIFEEWWAGPKRYKALFTAPGFHQTLFVTPAGPSIAGDPQWPDPVLRLIDPLLRSPLPSLSSLASIRFTNQDAKEKKVRIRCAAVVPGTGPRPFLDANNLWLVSAYCFTGDLPALRMETGPDLQIVFNSFALFQGRYIAQSIQIFRTGLPDLDIHVDTFNTVGHSTPASPAPAADAITPGHRVSGDPPQYPWIAKQRDIHGSVLLSAMVQKDGTVTDVMAVSGPPELLQAAIDAVRTWRYTPWRQNGKPVPFPVWITMTFTLNGRS